MAKHNQLGELGESMAEKHLLKNGYSIEERNYRFQKAEVDLIARKGNLLAVVEVKTRSTIDFGSPQDFVKPKQIKRLIVAIDHYVKARDLNVEVRFDIIAIVKRDNRFAVEHIEDAFYHF